MKDDAPGPGHNSDLGISANRLKSFVDRIERLEDEKRAMLADIREVYSEAKATGFDPKVIRHIIKERRIDVAERMERDAIRDVYANALGMVADLPLGKSAIDKATK